MIYLRRIKENLSTRYMQRTYRVTKGVRKRVEIGGGGIKKGGIKIIIAQ